MTDPTNGKYDAAYDGTEPDFVSSGTTNATIFEYALWQIRLLDRWDPTSGTYTDSTTFNTSLEPVVKGIGSPIETKNGRSVLNRTFFESRRDNLTSLLGLFQWDYENRPYVLESAGPIGVRCVSSSSLGTARLDGIKSVFSNFERANALFKYGVTPRYGLTARRILTHSQISSLFQPSGSYARGSYSGYFQPQDLKNSIMLAYALDALQLMYDGTYSFQCEWSNPNMTSSRPGSVLAMGPVPGALPLALFAVWALCCTIVGIAYGFRKRSSSRLDGWLMVRQKSKSTARGSLYDQDLPEIPTTAFTTRSNS